jgi:hypothetical protein
MPAWTIIRLSLLLIAALFAGNAAAAAERETSTDRPGLDFRDFELTVPLPDRCEAACNEDAKCRAWTFAWPGKKGPRAHCFLKTGLPPKKPDNCCISGVRTKAAPPEKPVEPPATPDPEVPAQPDRPPQQSLAEACTEYANTAVDQNKRNEELVCDLAGSRWGYGFDVYYNWCMSKSTEESRKANTEARDRELRECGDIFGLPSATPEPEPQRDLVKENACREYASLSVEQSEQARDLQCGFRGPRWTTAYQQHFSWCMSVGDTYRDSETAERSARLEECRPRTSPARACELYARSAFRLARRNYERRCGFSGPRWTRDIDTHKSWCETADPQQRRREQTARHRALAACSGGPRAVTGCAQYAQMAIRHAEDNRRRSCGFAGPRWQPDYEYHFISCMKSTPPERFKERSYRMRALLECRTGLPTYRENENQFLYEYRWVRPRGTGDNWTSGWIRTGSRAQCEHKVAGCRCGWLNYCANFRNGETALWWRDGCDFDPLRIICEVRKR